MPKPKITAELVLAAKSGDSDALAAVARFFEPCITKVSTRPFFDEYGKRYDLVDEEIRKHIESRLLLQIVYGFNPDRVLNGEKITEG